MQWDEIVILRVGEPVPLEWSEEELEPVDRPPIRRAADGDLRTDLAEMITSDGAPEAE